MPSDFGPDRRVDRARARRRTDGAGAPEERVAPALAGGPAGLDVAAIRRIQRSAGNQAVGKLLRKPGATLPAAKVDKGSERLATVLKSAERRVTGMATRIIPAGTYEYTFPIASWGDYEVGKRYFGFEFDYHDDEAGVVVVERDGLAYVLDDGAFRLLFDDEFPTIVEQMGLLPTSGHEAVANRGDRRSLGKAMPGRLGSGEIALVQRALRTVEMIPSYAPYAAGIRRFLEQGRIFSGQLDRAKLSENTVYGVHFAGGLIVVDFEQHAKAWERDQGHHPMLGNTLVHEYHHNIDVEGEEPAARETGDAFEEEFQQLKRALFALARSRCRPGADGCEVRVEHRGRRYLVVIPKDAPLYVLEDEPH
jgi:hypothetical protein